MNYKSASLMFALAGALALASVGCSQSPGDDQAELPATTATAPMTPTPPPYTATSSPAPMGTAGTPPAAMGSAGMAPSSSDFDQLAGGKGYVTAQDAGNNAWLASHFDQCDADRDGKLTRDEFDRCTQGQNPMGGQNPELPPASSVP